LTGSPPLRYLERVRRDFAPSLHSVGTSLGSHLPLDRDHLRKLKRLVDRFQSWLVSEHPSWSHGREWYTDDLLPLLYTEESLQVVVDHIDQVQQSLQRTILIENPSTCLQFRHNEIPEEVFLVEAAKRSGAGLLLDVNNVYVSCRNHGWDIAGYLAAIPVDLVCEIHLAGHSVQRLESDKLRIDDHGSPVCAEVWDLYRHCLDRIGPVPTLIEWDSNVPEFEVLLREAKRAEALLRPAREARHGTVRPALCSKACRPAVRMD
jgi:uncharacterized protein (UPF0276 family)